MNTLPNRISLALRRASIRKDTMKRLARELNREIKEARFVVTEHPKPYRTKDGRLIRQWCLKDTRRAA